MTKANQRSFRPNGENNKWKAPETDRISAPWENGFYTNFHKLKICGGKYNLM